VHILHPLVLYFYVNNVPVIKAPETGMQARSSPRPMGGLETAGAWNTNFARYVTNGEEEKTVDDPFTQSGT
jgi:hypothetical protein